MSNPRDVIQALDGASSDLLWEYRRSLPEDVDEFLVTVLAEVNRNLAIYDDLIIDTSVDDYVFALDAATGRLAWETLTLDYRTHPANQTSGPIIGGGKVISGRSCTPQGGPDACVITAQDARTGEELWRTHTIPAPSEPSDESWPEAGEQGLHLGGPMSISVRWESAAPRVASRESRNRLRATSCAGCPSASNAASCGAACRSWPISASESSPIVMGIARTKRSSASAGNQFVSSSPRSARAVATTDTPGTVVAARTSGVSQEGLYTCLSWPTARRNALFPGRLWTRSSPRHGSSTANLF